MGERQAERLRLGTNSALAGDYLATTGRSIDEDGR